jgi:hypothetical protein
MGKNGYKINQKYWTILQLHFANISFEFGFIFDIVIVKRWSASLQASNSIKNNYSDKQ